MDLMTINFIIGWRFWAGSRIWLTIERLHSSSGHTMVSCTRAVTWNQGVHYFSSFRCVLEISCYITRNVFSFFLRNSGDVQFVFLLGIFYCSGHLVCRVCFC